MNATMLTFLAPSAEPTSPSIPGRFSTETVSCFAFGICSSLLRKSNAWAPWIRKPTVGRLAVSHRCPDVKRHAEVSGEDHKLAEAIDHRRGGEGHAAILANERASPIWADADPKVCQLVSATRTPPLE